MQMCPGWCDNYKDRWAAIVREWTTDAAYQRRRERREGRLQMRGAPHHQGKQSLLVFMERWVCFC